MPDIESRINESINRIKILRSGGKIKCPDCPDGYIEASGDPSKVSCFSCKCGCRIFIDNKKLKI